MANVVVTGGSRGIGLAIVQTLAAAGYTVIAIARDETKELAAASEQDDAPDPATPTRTGTSGRSYSFALSTSKCSPR